MKRKIFTLFLAATTFVFSSRAQINKGSILLGGAIAFAASTEEIATKKQTNFYVSPLIGIAIGGNTITGVSLQYGHEERDGSYDLSAYAAGIFLRKYKPLGKGFYLFGEGNLKFHYSRHTDSYINTQPIQEYESNNYAIGIALNPGVSYEISRRLQLELIFPDFLVSRYSWGKREARNPPFAYVKTTSFTVSSNLSINGINSIGIGIRLLLNKAK